MIVEYLFITLHELQGINVPFIWILLFSDCTAKASAVNPNEANTL